MQFSTLFVMATAFIVGSNALNIEPFLEAKDYWIATCICILGGSIKYRESIGKGFNGQLRDVLSTLLKKPEEEAIETEENGQIELALNELDN
ncbi:MAG: hypothetical protein Q9194_005534 [Teloschistes cf. exilis]